MAYPKGIFLLIMSPVLLLSACTKSLSTIQPQSQNNLCLTEKDAIDSVVVTFEKGQMETNALTVLALFTAATTEKDKQTYDTLYGKMDGEPSLYNTALTQIQETGYTIVGDPIKTGQTCIVTVQEQRTPFSNAKPATNSASQTVTTNLVLVKVGNDWKIDQYYNQGQAPGKFAAWGY